MSEHRVYKRAGAQKGWVFEMSKSSPQECDWGDIYDYVRAAFQLKGKVVLDIGTAEGLKFLALSPFIFMGIGIDLEEGMIKLASMHLGKADNMRFYMMDSGRLRFPDDFFDLVICRHTPFNLEEVKRVLRRGGTFITQQVHERDKQNLKEWFKRGQNYEVESDKSLDGILKLSKTLKFKKIRHYFSDLDYYFNSKQHLVDFLESTPVIPKFDLGREQAILENFIKKHQTEKGIKSNSARYLIKIQK